MEAELPNPFQFENGQFVVSASDWRQRRQELLDSILDIEYGHLPPVPKCVKAEELHQENETILHLMAANHIQYRLTLELDAPVHFILDLLIPPGKGPFPVLLTGDGCWRYLSDDCTRAVMQHGYMLAGFNRLEVASDNGTSDRISGLYRAYPKTDYGALAAWAWGYHRCIDYLVTRNDVDVACIAVVGHSRGGKTVLLAGATDERIALTAANNSGCCGAGCFRWQGPKSETMADALRWFPYWYSPRLKEFVGKEGSLPFDQHCLKALVAPRSLLTTEALGDLWANPTGTWQTHLAAREVYRFLGVGQRIGIVYRDGTHEHNLKDWTVLLHFADWQFRGKQSPLCFDISPFSALPKPFSRAAPQ